MSYKSRVLKNEVDTDGNSELKKLANNLTDLIYKGDFKNVPPNDIYDAMLAVCIKSKK